MRVAKQCMNYLYVTRDLGMTFKKSESGKWCDIDERGNHRNDLETYVALDYGNSKESSKSVSNRLAVKDAVVSCSIDERSRNLCGL